MKGLRDAFQAKRIYPVVLTSALHNIGSATLLDLLADVFPDPAKRGVAIGHTRNGQQGKRVAQKNQRCRAGFHFRVQDAGRSVLRAHHAISK